MRVLISVMVVGLVVSGCEGPQGPVGPEGPGIAVASTVTCSRVEPGFRLDYEVAIYPSGDVVATCAVADLSRSSSGLRIHKAGSPDVSRQTCEVTFDQDSTPSGGRWTFQLDSLSQRKGTYSDLGSPYDRISLLLEDCSGS